MVSAGSGFAPAAGGMTTYYEGLLSGLCRQVAVERIFAFVPPWHDGAAVPADPKIETVRCTGLTHARVGRVLHEHSVLGLRARRVGVDVFLSTHNVKPLAWNGPAVVVLQSIQWLFLPDRVGRLRKAYLKVAVPWSLTRAEVVIAVTETQRRDAIKLFDLDPEKIVTVHHGPSGWAVEAAASLEEYRRATRPIAGARPYVLSVSSLYGLKNHRRLVEAFAKVVEDTTIEHELVIAGRDADVTRAELAALASECGVTDRVRLLGPYPQESMPALMAHADAIAYPSLYETFGHPVLEAFAFRCPLLTSEVGGTAEVAGSAALLVDPRSTEGIANGLRHLLTSPGLRDRLAQAGVDRLAEFSWDRCATGTVAALETAIRRSRREVAPRRSALGQRPRAIAPDRAARCEGA